jgi:mannose-6-phosphate isomerase-like protein (cupin superfamily)
MKSGPATALVSLTQALAGGPPLGNLAVPVFSRGSVIVEMYSPAGTDPQKPHTRDELYFVARGNGNFFDGQERRSVSVGSFIFVAAGQLHRFEDFSDDFAVWVVFYGPTSGDPNGQNAS